MPQSFQRFRSTQHQERYLKAYDRILGLWPVPFTEQYIETSFGKTHILAAGPADAPPLVLLHGMAASGPMWLFSVGALSRHYRCYCPDMISDVGKSICTTPPKSSAELMQWMNDLLDGLGCGQVRLAGMSYGAWIGMMFALHVPERVQRLVVMGPPQTFDRPPLSFILGALLVALTRLARVCRWNWERTFCQKEKADHPYYDLVLAAMQGSTFPKIVQPTLLTDEELRRIAVPTTVLLGDHEVSYKHGPEAALRRAGLIPGARTHLVPNAGHPVMMENPGQVHQWMLEGLA